MKKNKPEPKKEKVRVCLYCKTPVIKTEGGRFFNWHCKKCDEGLLLCETREVDKE